MSTVVLRVRGMSCGHCVRAVTEALEAVDGVRGASVDLDAGTARVDYEDARARPEALAAAVAAEGYEAELAPA